MHNVTEFAVKGGIGRVWEKRSGHWGWAHPDGSEGEEATFEEAQRACEGCGAKAEGK